MRNKSNPIVRTFDTQFRTQSGGRTSHIKMFTYFTSCAMSLSQVDMAMVSLSFKNSPLFRRGAHQRTMNKPSGYTNKKENESELILLVGSSIGVLVCVRINARGCNSIPQRPPFLSRGVRIISLEMRLHWMLRPWRAAIIQQL